MKKPVQKIISICFILLGILCLLPLLSDHKQPWLSIGGSIILYFGIQSFINSFQYGSHERVPTRSPSRETEDILIKEYQFCDLNHFGNILKLYYSEDKQKRIVFFQLHDNAVKVRVQQLLIYDCSETKTPIWTGSWSTSQGKNSFYGDINIALKEYENELQQGYMEMDLNKILPVNLYNNPEFFAEIEWLKEKDGGRKTIPYGNRYMPQIVIHKFNPNEPLHSILLRNVKGVEKHKTIALVRYVYDTAPNDLYENLLFDVHEGSRKVATGVILSQRENIDI